MSKSHTSRRAYLIAVGTAGLGSLAGCSSQDGETGDTPDPEPDSGTDTGSAAESTSPDETRSTETTSATAPAGTGAWRQSQFDDGNSGYAPDNVGPTGAVETRWRFNAEAGPGSYAIYGGPAVADGTVYIGSEQLFALDTADGSTLWTFNPGRESGIKSSAVVVGDTVYVGSWRNPSSGAVHAVDATDGSELWRFPTADYVEASPTVVDGTVYVGSKGGTLVAVSGPTESERTATSTSTSTRTQVADIEWYFETGGQIRASPAVVDGTVYFGSSDDTLYAVDAADGTEQWTFDVGGNVDASPAVVDGTVYVGSGYDGPVYAVNAADGTEQWRYEAADSGPTSPVVTDDAVVVAGEGETVVSLGLTDGRERWSQQLTGEDGVVESMAAAGGVIYAPCDAAGLQALDADDGSLLWSALDYVEAPPAVAGGTVYVGTSGDKLYALQGQ